jgi:hypothetical protein
MDGNRKPARKGPVTAAIILTTAVLLGVYVAGYYLLVEPICIVDPKEHWEPEYRWGGIAAEVAFHPVNLLDRRLRPDVWKRRSAY